MTNACTSRIVISVPARRRICQTTKMVITCGLAYRETVFCGMWIAEFEQCIICGTFHIEISAKYVIEFSAFRVAQNPPTRERLPYRNNTCIHWISSTRAGVKCENAKVRIRQGIKCEIFFALYTCIQTMTINRRWIKCEIKNAKNHYCHLCCNCI